MIRIFQELIGRKPANFPMKNYANLRIERDHRGVVRLELNRPEKHNALNEPLIDDLRNAAEELAVDASVRVVVLAGAGKMSSGGSG